MVPVRLQQDLDGQVAAQVGVAALEDRAHAAPGDLAEELEPRRAVGQRGHLGRVGLDERSSPASHRSVSRKKHVAEVEARDPASPSSHRRAQGRRWHNRGHHPIEPVLLGEVLGKLRRQIRVLLQQSSCRLGALPSSIATK